MLFITDGGLEWNGCMPFVRAQQLSFLGLKAFCIFLSHHEACSLS